MELQSLSRAPGTNVGAGFSRWATELEKNFFRWLRTRNGRYVAFPVVFACVETASNYWGIVDWQLDDDVHVRQPEFLHYQHPLWIGIAIGLVLAFVWRHRNFVPRSTGRGI